MTEGPLLTTSQALTKMDIDRIVTMVRRANITIHEPSLEDK